MPIQMTRAHRDALHDGLFIATGVLDPATSFVGVGKAIADKGLDTKLSDITEGTGAGFARQKVTTWGAPHDMIDQRRVTDGPKLTFLPTTTADAMAVNCWFIASADTLGTLKRWGHIVPPVFLNGPADSMAVVARIFTDPNGTHTGEVVING